ncbi:hypothetical protein GN956_G20442 [Arapaima gigas]
MEVPHPAPFPTGPGLENAILAEIGPELGTDNDSGGHGAGEMQGGQETGHGMTRGKAEVMLDGMLEEQDGRRCKVLRKTLGGQSVWLSEDTGQSLGVSGLGVQHLMKYLLSEEDFCYSSISVNDNTVKQHSRICGPGPGTASRERAHAVLLAKMAAVESEVFSATPPGSPSSGDSVSLLEIMEDTRLVLNAFLRKTLTVAPSQRPGQVGGAYRDTNKFSARKTEGRRWTEDGWDSLDEKISVAEGKKHGFKDLIKKRLRRRSRPGVSQHSKETSKASAGSSNGGCPPKPDKHEADAVSVSSSSSGEGSEKKEKKKKKKRRLRSLSSLLRRIKPFKKDGAEEEHQHPRRPDSLALGGQAKPESSPVSPSYPPQFYDEVAGTLDRIARKRTIATPVKPAVEKQPADLTGNSDKDAVVRQLVQILSMQGDAINKKIESDPFLRSTLARLSYPSFAKLLDVFACENDAPSPVSANPTLTRMAITMEVSRCVITATGAQRMRGYAERYMQTFAPWVQSHGGWDKVVQLKNVSEYD